MRRLLMFFYYPGPTKAGLWRVYQPNNRKNWPGYRQNRAYYQCFGVLWNWKACWIGGHYSKHNKRLCVNVVPFLTFWWARPGGTCP